MKILRQFIMKQKFLYSITAISLFTSCGHDHDHDHDGHHNHDHDNHHGHFQHSDDEDLDPIVITQYNKLTELFMEHPPLIQGKSSKFIIHLTRLVDFKPIRSGQLEVKIIPNTGKEVLVKSEMPARKGVYTPSVIPNFAGKAKMEISLFGKDINSTHSIPDVFVYKTEQEIESTPETEENSNEIVFLKEQQWEIEYATVPVIVKPMAKTVSATGILRLPKSNVVKLTSPIEGTVAWTESKKFLEIGSKVKEGDQLFLIKPNTGWNSGLSKLKEQYLLARLELEKLEDLLEKEAVAQKRVEEARIKMNTLAHALSRMGIRNPDGSTDSIIARINSPRDGLISLININPGERVKEGDVLAVIINSENMILEASIPNSRVAQIKETADATFRIGGDEMVYRISDLGGKPISEEPVPSKDTNFSKFVFQFPNKDGKFDTGTPVVVKITDRPKDKCVVIPEASVMEDQGRKMIYVQTAGETVEKRYPYLGDSDGEWTEVISGVNLDERIVTKGTSMIRLASLGEMEMGHGHAH